MSREMKLKRNDSNFAECTGLKRAARVAMGAGGGGRREGRGATGCASRDRYGRPPPAAPARPRAPAPARDHAGTTCYLILRSLNGCWVSIKLLNNNRVTAAAYFLTPHIRFRHFDEG
ncbi:hypothetical protein EVAR_12081_1 [Eumeta japonica]|uniref:Uncharacterized protein n=1 Tax=Eumeta variegata TaxID=151549 RepID=A0A4C1U5E7_EUMVA|nr:hypothetical protein EVAR_12081_1 [Eumeta japonica]